MVPPGTRVLGPWARAAFSPPLEDRGEQSRLSFPNHGPLPCCPQALKWHLSPLTIVSWLNVYMQVAYLNDLYEVLLPQYPQHIFIQIVEVSAGDRGACPTPQPEAPPGGCRPATQRPVLRAAFGSVRPGRWLLRVFLWRPGSFCAVPFLLVRADAEGLR